MAPITASERRASNTTTDIKLDALHDDITDIKLVLKELTVAINRLAIVEELATLYGGSLELSARPGGGLLAVLVLPAADSL